MTVRFLFVIIRNVLELHCGDGCKPESMFYNPLKRDEGEQWRGEFKCDISDTL
jgi:hypothetical protein